MSERLPSIVLDIPYAAPEDVATLRPVRKSTRMYVVLGTASMRASSRRASTLSQAGIVKPCRRDLAMQNRLDRDRKLI
ncbi:hypothetical protein DOTSEDRAFT_71159 [Dothistroma septosporum NZE10]|uniref:Uncharacterized protein n=1 Tax=Dothistroma septosporum (strain NZE10 / CBS 128990) TaxID=675120 RepID=N1PPM9_DOTSN|nr:hypothetical protein DOTSEDRAFT_71159 [Dothistroma septosporum NZE10]